MLISVIIPVFNGEKYLDEAIQSALNQTMDKKKYEVIIVDDRSTDRSYAIARKYENAYKNVKTSRHSDNQGVARTLNTGIVLADGEWIKWVSADDVMYPNCLEILLENVTDKNCIYYTHYHIIDKNGKIKKIFEEPVRRESELWKFFYGNGSTSFIHRTVFDTCGLFDESLPHSEDYELWLRATQLYGIKLKLIPHYTIKYRNHPDQLTHKVGGTLDEQIKTTVRARLAEKLHTSS